MDKKMFDGQNKDENVIGVYRKHLSLVLIYVLMPIFLAIISLAVFSSGTDYYLFYACLFILFISLLALLNKLLPWWFTYYILTDQRLKYVNQKSLFRKSVMDIKYSDIEHASCSSTNIWQEIIKTPTVYLQIIGGNLEIRGIARSQDLYDQLQNLLINKAKNEN